ncbi:MAG: ABC transporter substrate-binding protein [Lautropia sp.]
MIALSWVREYRAILALPDSGIRTARDLRGKRIGVPMRMNDQIDFFRAMSLRGCEQGLATEGLDLCDVELVDLPVAESYIVDQPSGKRGTLFGSAARARRQRAESFALVRGEIDALYASGSLGAYLAAMLDAHEIVEFGLFGGAPERGGNESPATVTVDRALLRERPEVVERFLAVVLQAAAWATSHPRESARGSSDVKPVHRRNGSCRGTARIFTNASRSGCMSAGSGRSRSRRIF